MLRLLFTVACFVLAGCAGTNNGLHNNGTIQVTGVGKTFEEAKINGFAKAVEIVVGSVLVTESQVSTGKLVKDDIIEHSAGYVDNFTILHKTIEPSRILLQMDVTVRSSKIAERVLNKAKADGRLQGERLSAQYQTYARSRTSGDSLLNKILAGYPSQAFDIKQTDSVEFKLDKNRNVFIIIPYELRWNYKYLSALNEVMSITQDGYASGMNQDVVAIQSKDPSAWILGSTNKYYFNDSARFNQIANTFLGRVTVTAIIRDDNGNQIFTGCEEAFFNGLYVYKPYIIKGNSISRDTVQIFVRKESLKFRDLNIANHIELSFSTETCFNYEQ